MTLFFFPFFFQERGQGERIQPVARTQKLHTEANSQRNPPPSESSTCGLI